MKRKTVATGLKEHLEEYLSDCACRGLSTATISEYRKELTRLLAISDDPNEIVSAISAMDVSASTRSNLQRFLSVFCNWLYGRSLISQKPLMARYRGVTACLKTYSDEDLQTLLKEVPKTFPEHRTYTMISCVLSTGARAETLRNIRLEDVDLGNHVIFFRHLKNGQTYNCPIPPSFERVLREYINAWELKDFLFPTEDNSQLAYHGLNRALINYCSRRDVECLGIHAFRRNFATAMAQSGVPAFILQKMLTHSTLTMTLRYINLNNLDVSEQINQHCILDKFQRSKVQKSL